MTRVMLISGAVLALLTAPAAAQEKYELRVPGTAVGSTAYLSATELTIVHQGAAVRYQRDRQFDGQAHYGFSSRQLRKVIRWPRASRGRFEIGDLQGNQVAFRASQMEILPRAAGGVPGGPVILPVGPARPLDPRPGQGLGGGADLGVSLDARFYYQLTSLACLKQGQVLQAEPLRGRAQMVPLDRARQSKSYWRLIDAGRGAFRLQSPNFPGMSLSASHTSVFLNLEATVDDARQLWRLQRAGDGYYRILNVAATNAGSALDSDGRTGFTRAEKIRERRVVDPVTGRARIVEETVPVDVPRPGVVFMARSGSSTGQFWRLTRGPVIDSPLDLAGASRLVSRRLIPQPPLAPARVQLHNSTTDELWVLLEDLGDFSADRIRIPPRDAVEVAVPRDPGQIYEVVREVRRTSFGVGGWVQQTERVAVAPQPIIRLSAYRLGVQSIVRDSTPAGGGRVEEVGFSPKSVGMFLLPPGDRIAPGQRIDVFATASAARNPGAVTRIDPEQWVPTSKPADPLQKILNRRRP